MYTSMLRLGPATDLVYLHDLSIFSQYDNIIKNMYVCVYKYMKLVSFHWPPLEAGLCQFLLFALLLTKIILESVKTKATVMYAE
jgi:hypothetical protein